MINVDQIGLTPFDEMRLLIDDEAIRKDVQEVEELEERAEEEDLQRAMQA